MTLEDQAKLSLMMERFVHPNSPFSEQVYVEKEVETAEGKVKRKKISYFPVRKGMCKHKPQHSRRDCPDVTDDVFTNKHLLMHLQGKKTFAPYQISRDDKVKWVCFDVDAYDAPTDEIQAKTVSVVRKVQRMVGPHHCLVEQSGSKGYHIWVFFDQPIPTNYAFAFGHKVVGDVGIDSRLNVEVYPKQQTNTVLGNTVKLPLGIHQKTQERCFFVTSKFVPHEDQWEALASVRTVPWSWVEQNINPTPINSTKEKGEKYVPLCLTDILDRGCGEGMRDEAAFRLACYFRDRGLNEDYASLVLHAWNKHNQPPLEAMDLDNKIDSAYTKDYPYRPCLLPQFDGHCRSKCSFFNGKVQRRWFIPDKSPVGTISRD